jgi:hypothetical protein
MRNRRSPHPTWTLVSAAFATASLHCSGQGAFSAATDAGHPDEASDASIGDESIIIVVPPDAGPTPPDAGPTPLDAGPTPLDAGPIPLDVTPGSSKLGILRSLSFTGAVPVTWVVEEGSAGGTIDPTGEYVSPATPGTYHVVATSKSDPTVSQIATLTVVGLQIGVIAGAIGGRGNIDGISTSAHFRNPVGVAVVQVNAPDYTLLIADSFNDTIRKYDSSINLVTTLAGTPGVQGVTNGVGPAALFTLPTQIAADAMSGQAWVNSGACVRTIDASSGTVATLTGQCDNGGHQDGSPPAALMSASAMILGPRSDALYVCEESSTESSFYGIRRIDPSTGAITSILSNVTCAHLASDVSSERVYFDRSDGSIAYFTDSVAGGPGVSPPVTLLVSGMPQTQASTLGIAALQGANNQDDVYAGAYEQAALYRYQAPDSAFDVTPFSGSATQAGFANGPVASALFAFLLGITADPVFNRLFVSDAHAIRSIDLNFMTVGALLGGPATFTAVDGPLGTGRLTGPVAVASDPSGSVYIADVPFQAYANPGSVIRKLDSSGTLTTLSGVPSVTSTATTPVDGPATVATFNFPQAMTYAGGSLYVVDVFGEAIRAVDVSNGSVSTLAGQLGVSGSSDGFNAAAHFAFYSEASGSGYPSGGGITTDGTNLYVADSANYAIRQVVIATGQVSTVAGGTRGTANGIGKAAQFLDPVGIAYDRGTLYVADGQDNVIRQIDLATSAVTTLVGLSGMTGSADGNASVATFQSPFNLLADGLGSLYIVESQWNLQYLNIELPRASMVRRVDLTTSTVSTVAGTRGQLGVATGATPSTLNCPTGLALAPSGDTLIGDLCDGVVVRLSAL